MTAICKLLRGLWVLLLMLVAAPAVLAQPVITQFSSTPGSPLIVNSTVQFQAQASVTGGGALEYRWDFGDGTPRTDWLPAAQIQHVYTRAGTYTALLQVRHATQGLSSATLTLVVRLAAAPSARQSSAILVHAARREVWSVNPDHGTVSVLHADALTRLAEITVGDTPVALALDDSGFVWVSLREADRLVRIDPLTRALAGTLELGYGARPVAVVVAPDGTGYAALSGPGQIQRFATASGVAGQRLDVGPQLAALTLSADGSALYVSRLVSASGQGSATVWRVDTAAFNAAQAIALPLDSNSPDSGTAARGLPNYVGALALAEDGVSLWYGAKKDNILRGVFREGQALTFESVVRSLLGRIDASPAAPTELVSARMDLDDAGRVAALLLPPGSSHLFAAQDSNNRVLVLDPWNRREVARLPTGLTPQGLAFDAQTRRLYVQNVNARSVSVFATGALLDDGLSVPGLLAEISATLVEPLSPQVLHGKQVFNNAADPRMSQDGYTACTACHLDGGGDGRVWDFTQLGEGLRNTTSLRGTAGLGRGLVHWSGNFDEIQDFEVPIRNLFGGTGFMADKDYFESGRNHPLGPPKAGFSTDLDALAAYVASLDRDERSPHRNSDGSITADGAAGRMWFSQLLCQRCHAGAAFTDSPTGVRHEVGTLSAASGQRLGRPLLALDTPSLRGLFHSAPYLHDGSAETLEAVLLARNPQGAHGDIGLLDATQRAQLWSFLLQIDASEPAVAPAAQLVLTAPVANAQFRPGELVSMAVSTDLPQLTRVEYLVDGAVVATSTQAPWTASWLVPVEQQGALDVHAKVFHDQGRFNTLSPAVRMVLPGDAVFGDGFEP